MSESGERRAENIIQQENNGFGPFLKQRGSNASKVACYLLITLAFVSLFLLDPFFFEKHDVKVNFALTFIAMCVGEILKRFCLLTEEIRQKDSRYNGDWKKAFKVTFTFKSTVPIGIAAVCAVWIVYAWFNNSDFWKNGLLWQELFVISASILPCFSYLFDLRSPSIVEQSILNEQQNMNVADGLAWSYYFGYLYLVLPHVKEQIDQSEFCDKIQVSKLFILMPKNCFTYPKLSDVDHRLSVVGSTPDLQINRGGIQERVYKHSVHKIEINNETHHCLVEYATPLLSLWDMSRHAEAGLGSEERDVQVKIFLTKLKDILDTCPTTKNKYCLVPLSGDENNVAEIIVRAIKDDLASVSGM